MEHSAILLTFIKIGQKYCRMLQGEHSAILSTFIKILFSFKISVLSIYKWPFKTGFTVQCFLKSNVIYRISLLGQNW